MDNVSFGVRHNPTTISSIPSFAGITGKMHSGHKDVYFLRGIGCSGAYLAEIQKMDLALIERQARSQCIYLRIESLPKLANPDEINFYSRVYDDWSSSPGSALRLKAAQDPLFSPVLAHALRQAQEAFLQNSPNASDSIIKNFMVKLFFWSDLVLRPFWENWQPTISKKLVYTGVIKKQEYLFCYLATLLGIDALLLVPAGQPDLSNGLLRLSGSMHLGEPQSVIIPPLCVQALPSPATPPENANTSQKHAPPQSTRKSSRPVVVIPPRSRMTGGASVTFQRAELASEQLALLASSVVMIEVQDQSGKTVSGGSGIMIGTDGFILTNHHVVCRGRGYSVHIEEDSAVYHTSEIIKTHALLDLALIRIPRHLSALPLYQHSQPLVRGQKVVAIGSPLGLFNSVSDGIISGFRTMNDVDMIQFTAPTSPGSSGGALLNLYGEVIGISTAGFNEGQNLNLAVGFQHILPFIKGFVQPVSTRM